eukprot:1567689-Amphidinium_carterae.1
MQVHPVSTSDKRRNVISGETTDNEVCTNSWQSKHPAANFRFAVVRITQLAFGLINKVGSFAKAGCCARRYSYLSLLPMASNLPTSSQESSRLGTTGVGQSASLTMECPSSVRSTASCFHRANRNHRQQQKQITLKGK